MQAAVCSSTNRERLLYSFKKMSIWAILLSPIMNVHMCGMKDLHQHHRTSQQYRDVATRIEQPRSVGLSHLQMQVGVMLSSVCSRGDFESERE